MKIKIITSLTCFLLLLLSIHTAEATPTDTIRTTVESIVAILDKNVGNLLNNDQRSRIWENIKNAFDFNEISKRALARNWKSFSGLEKKIFSNIFGQFLGNIYIEKIQKEYENEEVVYVDEKLLNHTHAIVKTKVVKNSLTIPIDYKLISSGDKTWKIYDISVEGISLVANYRTQFRSILKKETPDQLIERLNEKLVSQKIRY